MIPPKILDTVSPAMLTHLVAATNYTVLHQVNGKKLISSYSLKVFAELLHNRTFIRVDRSNLVNRSYISRISERKGDMYIHLKNHTKFLIPRRRKAMLIDQYPSLLNLALTTSLL